MNTLKKLLYIIFGLSISALSVWYLNQQASLKQVLPELWKIPIWSLLLAILFVLMSFVARVVRWRLIATAFTTNPNSVTFSKTLSILSISYLYNNVLFFRVGDIYRAYQANKIFSISFTHAAGSMIYERALDLFVILIYLFLACMYLQVDIIGWFPQWLLLFAIALATTIVWVPGLLLPIANGCLNLLSKTFPLLKNKLSHAQTSLKLFCTLVSSNKLKGILFFHSLLIWFFELLLFFTIAASVQDITHRSSMLLAMPVSSLTTLIPSAPGYIGTFDLAITQTMSHFGNSSLASASVAIAIHFILWTSVTLIGLIFLLKQNAINFLPSKK
ncbi:MAG: lysylphosphatidylglycerol synthase transmembrane domain-containing protein [Methylacidiphilales bacterium]|nr:lysylphosphatidylglycerol synthase transmembrane domain-containing protein [Candidatus Methylacidiphilales bacterium]